MLSKVLPDAISSLGVVRLVSKDDIFALWRHVSELLGFYRSKWHLDDVRIRNQAAEQLREFLPLQTKRDRGCQLLIKVMK